MLSNNDGYDGRGRPNLVLVVRKFESNVMASFALAISLFNELPSYFLGINNFCSSTDFFIKHLPIKKCLFHHLNSN